MAQNERDRYPLHHAVRINDERLMYDAFFEFKADVNGKNQDGDTPLHLAIRLGDDHIERARQLLLLGANPMIRNRNGLTAVELAESERSVLHFPDHINNPEEEEEEGQPVTSSSNQMRGAADYESDDGWERYDSAAFTGGQGNTALHLAASIPGADSDVINLLRSYEFDINVQNNDGDTPLHLAANVLGNKQTILELLKNQRVDVNAVNIYGNTPLHLAASIPDNMETVEALLLNDKVDVNAVNLDGNTPLHLAASIPGNHMVIKRMRLVSQRVEANVGNREGDTPLHLALMVDDNSQSVRELLMYPDIDLYAENNEKDTPLHVAARSGSTDMIHDIISILSDRELDSVLDNARRNPNSIRPAIPPAVTVAIEARNNHGQSPLHIAAARVNNQEAVQYLLYSYSDENVEGVDYDGNTPLHLAASLPKNTEAIKIIQKSRSRTSTEYNRSNLAPLDVAARIRDNDSAEAVMRVHLRNMTYGRERASLILNRNPPKICGMTKHMRNEDNAMNDHECAICCQKYGSVVEDDSGHAMVDSDGNEVLCRTTVYRPCGHVVCQVCTEKSRATVPVGNVVKKACPMCRVAIDSTDERELYVRTNGKCNACNRDLADGGRFALPCGWIVCQACCEAEACSVVSDKIQVYLS